MFCLPFSLFPFFFRLHVVWAHCSSRDGVVREALCDALVPVHWWVSTCDGSRELSHGAFVWVVGPFVWVVDAI